MYQIKIPNRASTSRKQTEKLLNCKHSLHFMGRAKPKSCEKSFPDSMIKPSSGIGNICWAIFFQCYGPMTFVCFSFPLFKIGLFTVVIPLSFTGLRSKRKDTQKPIPKDPHCSSTLRPDWHINEILAHCHKGMKLWEEVVLGTEWGYFACRRDLLSNTNPCAQYTVSANISKKSEFGAEEG